MKTCIYDLSRFLKRIETTTPDGIGRVDFAYVSELVRLGPERGIFVSFGNEISREVPFDVVAELASLRAESWRSGDVSALVALRDREIDPSFYKVSTDVGAMFRSLTHEALRIRERAILRLFELAPRPPAVQDILMPRVLEIASSIAAKLDDLKAFDRPTRRLALMAIARSPAACAAIARDAAKRDWTVQRGLDPALRAKIDARGAKNCVYVNVNQALAWDQNNMLPFLEHRTLQLAIMIHDVIPFTEGEHISVLPLSVCAKNLRELHAGDTTFIMNSFATQHDFKAIAAKCDLPDLRILTAPLGTDGIWADASNVAKSADQPYFVAIGTLSPRKNYMLLLRIWKRLKLELGDAAPRLVVIGAPGWRTGEVLPALSGISAADLIDHHPDMSDAEMRKVLRGARALLFPSFSEGWGIPLVEAIQEGVPVICSDIPVFHEVGQGVPDYIDPLDGPAWQRAILSYMDANSTPRRAQMERRNDFSPITWSDHFDRIRRVIWGDAPET